MQCPFLRKMNVKYCGMNRRTMIPLGGTNLATERCAGPDHRDCPLLSERLEELPASESCPFLSVTDVHYCDVAPVRKLVPCNRTAASRCTDEGHRYCQLYLAMADPRPESPPDEPAGADDYGKVAMPDSLAYAPNHMWLDRGDGSTCHIGVDDFFVRALGRVDAVSFPYHRDSCRPVVRFTVDGAIFDLAFPNTMRCTEINAHLVIDPSEVMRDPYGRGWLFEGTPLPTPTNGVPDLLEQGLLRDGAARRWMDREYDRLSVFAHDHVVEHTPDTGLMMQDGGRFCGRLADVLDSGTLFRLHAAFFSLQGRRNRS